MNELPIHHRFSVIAGCIVACAGLTKAGDGKQDLPNVVLIYADDMGLDSVSGYNDKIGKFKSPALDQLMKEGMAFRNAHSSCSVCSPSRYSLLTGQYSWRTSKKAGIVGQTEASWIAKDRLTIPAMLKTKGYDTAMIGKWHLGWNWPLKDTKPNPAKRGDWSNVDFTQRIPGGPVDRGFDSYFGDDVPNWPPFTWFENDRVVIQPTATMRAGVMRGVNAGPAAPDWKFDAVLPTYVGRIQEYLSGRKDNPKPFFLYFPLPSPHTPIAPNAQFKGASGISPYVDFLMETDWAIGETLKALGAAGKKDNTLVIFIADNGTDLPTAQPEKMDSQGIHLTVHLKGGKFSLWEGGHRLPMLVRWPGRIQAGALSLEPVVQTDVFATLAEIVGHDLAPNSAEDSASLLPLLQGKALDSPLHKIIIHQDASGALAVSMGKWKLHLKSNQLYDLEADLKETTDVGAANPEVVRQIMAAFEQQAKHGRTRP